ncbi:MAG: PD-(D/E)XK nuclease family protein [Opitutaceae bacterium]|nr:PD-(D/E)XK nuclease family protein [Opitutaceae bacterium]
MSSASAQPRRFFLPWDRPLLPQVVAHLTHDWSGREALDLSGWLILVPTRQAGRRLRESLAAHAAGRGQAVLSPLVLVPEALMADNTKTGEATRLESLLAWAELLRGIALEDYRAVFPVDPPERSLGWATRLAGDLMRLQDTLAEVGLQMKDVPDRVEPHFPERERWRQLAHLEHRHAEVLAKMGLQDAQLAKIARAATVDLPSGVTRIVLVASPDPRPLALSVLQRHAQSVPLEVLIHAPEAEADSFDEWGRPVAEHWVQRPIEMDDFASHVELCSDPEAQADRVVELAKDYGREEGVLGFGVVDPEILTPLEGSLRQAGLSAYNPEGRPRQGDRLHQLLTALAGLARDGSFANVARLARHPDFLRHLQRKIGGTFSAARFLQAIDALQADHLPADLRAALTHWRGGAELRMMQALRTKLRSGEFSATAGAVPAEIFAGCELDLENPEDALLAESIEVWAGVAGEVARAAARFPRLTADEAWEMALRFYGEAMAFTDKPTGALELQGWLELMWEDAPHLVVAGLNEGRVPDAVVGDPFLPESLRRRLGLKTNAMRLACDAYCLQVLAASRRRGGRLDLLLGKTSAAGDPLRPSRLLLRCPDAELPARVALLFREVTAPGATVPWTRAWRLQLPVVAPPTKLAVTALRAWLDCPLRFYLARVLRLETVDTAKAELDALDFGTLCHAALEAMGREPGLRDCTDVGVLRAYLHEKLTEATDRKFGRTVTLPLTVQLESARQRLAYAAAVQAQSRSEGWVIEQVEQSFELEVAGLTVRGKIDRIDRHETLGTIRVLDYKTSDTAVNPAQAHLCSLPRGGTGPDWRVVAEGKRVLEWCDLQLPLYERVAAGQYPGAAVVCGYFNLPKAATETAIAHWDDYTPELAAAAWTCAQGVAKAICNREFWPPRELRGREAEWDDFAPLFHHGAAESVGWVSAPPGEGTA